VCIQSDDQSQHHVMLEGVTASTTKSLSEAFMSLFICHYVFNLEYGYFKLFFQFVQIFLLDISHGESKCLQNCVL